MSTRLTYAATAIAFLCSSLFFASIAASEEGMSTHDIVPVSGTVVDACSVDTTAGGGLQVSCTNSLAGGSASKTSSSTDVLLTGSDTTATSSVNVAIDPKTLYEAQGFDSFGTTYSPGIVEENALQNKNCGDKGAKPAGVTVTW